MSRVTSPTHGHRLVEHVDMAARSTSGRSAGTSRATRSTRDPGGREVAYTRRMASSPAAASRGAQSLRGVARQQMLVGGLLAVLGAFAMANGLWLGAASLLVAGAIFAGFGVLTRVSGDALPAVNGAYNAALAGRVDEAARRHVEAALARPHFVLAGAHDRAGIAGARAMRALIRASRASMRRGPSPWRSSSSPTPTSPRSASCTSASPGPSTARPPSPSRRRIVRGLASSSDA